MFNVVTENNSEGIICNAGEHLKLTITDSEGNVTNTIFDGVVPEGKQLQGSVIFKLRTVDVDQPIIEQK